MGWSTVSVSRSLMGLTYIFRLIRAHAPQSSPVYLYDIVVYMRALLVWYFQWDYGNSGDEVVAIASIGGMCEKK